MIPQFIKLNVAELEYGENYLLRSHMDIISMINRVETFNELRKADFSLKFELKRKINESLSLADALDKLLPKIKIEQPKEQEKLFPELSVKKELNKPSLDDELREIKKKLALLHQ